VKANKKREKKIKVEGIIHRGTAHVCVLKKSIKSRARDKVSTGAVHEKNKINSEEFCTGERKKSERT
jgi:hypothetical protein